MRWLSLFLGRASGLMAAVCFISTLPAQETNYLGAGTRAVAQRLQEIARKANPDHNPYLNRQRADLVKTRLAQATSEEERFDLTLSLSQELLNAGDNEGALVEIDKLAALFRERGLWETNKSLFCKHSHRVVLPSASPCPRFV